MLIPDSQTALLKQILAQLQDDLAIDQAQLTYLYTYLFLPGPESFQVADPDLRESILFLKELIKTKGITTLQGIVAYFEEEEAAIDAFMIGMMDRVDNEDAQEETRHSIFFMFHEGAQESVFVRNYLADQFDKLHLTSPPLSISFDGSYTRASKTYLNRFTKDIDSHIIFVWQESTYREIQSRHVNDVFWKVNRKYPIQRIFEPFFDLKCQNVLADYDKLLEQISEEKPLTDISIKMELTDVFCRTKSCYCNWAHKDSPLNASILLDGLDNCDTQFSVKHFDIWIQNVFTYILADKDWSILKSPKDHSWITSDNPGFVVEKDETGKSWVEAEYIWAKLHSRAAQFYYPLSKDYVLRIRPSDPKEIKARQDITFEESSEQEWQEINEHTVSTRHEMVFAGDRKLLEPLKLLL